MTHRIDPFFVLLSELNFFKYDSVKWTFFSNMTQRIEFLTRMTQRIECFFLKKIFLKELFFLWLKGLNFFRCKELNLFFFLFDSKNWTFFLQKWRKELSPFFCEYDAKNWTFFLFASKNWAFFSIWLKELNFCFPSIWLKEFNLFFELDPKGWTFLLSMTQRIEPFFFLEYDSKNHFWKRLKDCF